MKDGAVGVELIGERDRKGFDRLFDEPGLFDRMVAERAEATGYGFVIRDRSDLVGAALLRGIGGGRASELAIVVAAPSRRQGYATFGMGLVLQFAFQNLELASVAALPAAADSAVAWARILSNAGFDPGGELTRTRWLEVRDGPNLAALNPALRAILDAELALGNAVRETGTGWPDQESIFVRLREPFRSRPDPLPPGIEFQAINDPHWWTAEYHSTTTPRHLLVY